MIAAISHAAAQSATYSWHVSIRAVRTPPNVDQHTKSFRNIVHDQNSHGPTSPIGKARLFGGLLCFRLLSRFRVGWRSRQSGHENIRVRMIFVRANFAGSFDKTPALIGARLWVFHLAKILLAPSLAADGLALCELSPFPPTAVPYVQA